MELIITITDKNINMSIGISGRVTDFDSGAGVPGASVILVDSSGNATGPGTARILVDTIPYLTIQ